MSIFRSLFGTRQPATPPQARATTQPPAADPLGTRRELLRVVLRDTLARHGIPAAWIGSEMLATARGRDAGLHLRLQLKHWDPRLLACSVTLQQQIAQRVTLYDPLAHDWLLGISWQFVQPADSACPEMPDPKVWRSAALQSDPGAAAPRATDRKAKLHQMLAARDAQAAREQPDFARTQPMFAPTAPAEL